MIDIGSCGGCKRYVVAPDGQCKKCGWKSPGFKSATISVEPRKRSEGNSQAILDGSEPDGCHDDHIPHDLPLIAAYTRGVAEGQAKCAAGPWRFDMENMPTDGRQVWVKLRECDYFKYWRYSAARCVSKKLNEWSISPGCCITSSDFTAWAEIMPTEGK